MKQVPFTPTQTWGQRRDAFVARHLAQYRLHPTPRRALGGSAAYDVGDRALEAESE